VNTLPSSEFRKTFARLEAPVVVTVRGHPIGTWTPAQTVVIPSAPKAPATALEAPEPVPAATPKPAPKARSSSAEAQGKRDGWLRKLNGSTSQ
jgi:hypothetical protein